LDEDREVQLAVISWHVARDERVLATELKTPYS
jgi:hypothetical protein